MEHKNTLLNLLVLLVLAISCSPSKQSDALRILFIGNSYTFYNSSPELLKGLISEQFPSMDVETKLISGGGMTLEDHWQSGIALEAIEEGSWDYVVLQEQSKLGMGIIIDDKEYFGKTDNFFAYSRKFNEAIKKSGAQTVFLMTWSRRNQPEEQAILSHAYTAIAKELGAIVAPVGLVWDEIRTDEQLNLYADDGGHPSQEGSYLLATTLFSTLMKDSPSGLKSTISGYRLSSRGEASPEKELLIEIDAEKAQLIQGASWNIVSAMQASDNYLDLEQPAPSYSLPVLEKGEQIDLSKISGRWYGSGMYGAEYLGQIMDLVVEDGKAEVKLSFYSAHGQDEMHIKDATVVDDKLVVLLHDSLRSRDAELTLSLREDELKGLLVSEGHVSIYKNLNFDRSAETKGIDLQALDTLLEDFKSNIAKFGYVDAAKQYYEAYSTLIGESYMPEEFYLNAMGYNYLRDKKVEDALNSFKLAIAYYPQSVNTYDSYAEALAIAGRREEALEVYETAIELGTKTKYNNLDYIKRNYNKLKKDAKPSPAGDAMPPPPPPPPAGDATPPPPPPQ
jgi:tetratricopeptide (TPR) repeat protein